MSNLVHPFLLHIVLRSTLIGHSEPDINALLATKAIAGSPQLWIYRLLTHHMKAFLIIKDKTRNSLHVMPDCILAQCLQLGNFWLQRVWNPFLSLFETLFPYVALAHGRAIKHTRDVLTQMVNFSFEKKTAFPLSEEIINSSSNLGNGVINNQ